MAITLFGGAHFMFSVSTSLLKSGSRLCRSLVVNKTIATMSSNYHTYEEAIQKLNSLQSNKANLEQIRKDLKSGKKCTNLEDMQNYFHRVGVSLTKLDELSVIHVAGTKGKGSTSAMCESILRHHGFRTGLFTSPHLVAVRERIRVDGVIVSQDVFAEHFYHVYNLLVKTQAYEGDMPKYFAFLTVMAYNMFLKEKVDVAIIEVGIGGIVDYTNVLRKVPVVGISALGLDHTSILGTTLPQIAAAKAGIMKHGCEAYTVPQDPEAMRVLEIVANTIQCPLYIAPHYKTYEFPTNKIQLQTELDVYRTNASLAIQLAHAWMRITGNKSNGVKHIANKTMVNGKIDNFVRTLYQNGNRRQSLLNVIPSNTAEGLRNCRWPGRYQIIETDYARFCLDGAHTKESMEICSQWFIENNKYRDKILIFSATGDRDAETLLNPLKDIDFRTVFFVIPAAHKDKNKKNDNYSITEQNELIARCEKHADIWLKMHGSNEDCGRIHVLECVSDALYHIKCSTDPSNRSVMISGSLHLVGAALSLLDPNLSRDE